LEAVWLRGYLQVVRDSTKKVIATRFGLLAEKDRDSHIPTNIRQNAG
jgi:hypothetical protein